MDEMTRTLVVAWIVAALLWVAPGAAEDDPAMERLMALGTALQTRPTWTADYRQEFIPVGMEFGEEVRGEVWVSWPDRALFSTGAPVIRWMGLSGRSVRLLDFENGSCDDHLLTAEEWERIPLIAVLEPRAAVAQFSIVADGDRGLVLIPRESGGVSRVEITVGIDGLPERVTVKDPQGTVNTFDFSAWEPADGPPNDRWLPEAPDSIVCVGDPE